ncbi:MAG: FtsX-like permease family protein [Thermoplasmata archaeon]|jgi:putative ABC transport system permease protein|nr:FtsX-like permease family protein [Thermoplasmata archaeon]
MNGLQQLAILVAIVLVVVGTLAIRRRVFARMAVRSIYRRKTHSVVVVSGLLIATAMISGSLVAGDTLDYIISRDVMTSTGDVDIVVSARNDIEEEAYFNYTIAQSLSQNASAGALSHIDEASAAIREVLAVQNLKNGLTFARAGLFGIEAGATVNALVDLEGTPVSTEDISDGMVVVNSDLAGEIDAVQGDTILGITEFGPPVMLQVSWIADDSGLADWSGSAYVFADLAYVQNLIGKPGLINRLDVSCLGSANEGYKVSDEAVAELQQLLPDDVDFYYDKVKADGLESAQAVSDMMSQLMVLMSSFAIIAGAALIVNIFVMLAEERKSEMGISRAIGMQRGDLTQTFMYEGMVYAAAAAVIGAIAGLAIAMVVMGGAAAIISGGGLEFTLHWEWESLGIAAAAGFLITMLTVVLASWRVSKLNIVRAIRNIPEPASSKKRRRYLALGIAGVVVGVIVTAIGTTGDDAWGIVSGPPMVALGIALLAARRFDFRIPLSVASAFVVYYTFDPFTLTDKIFGPSEGGMEMFLVSGLLLVSGCVIFVMVNSEPLLNGLMASFGRKRSLMPVFKIAVSYPMNKKFRTGLTIFMFALIMFTVIVIAMIASFQRESVEKTTQQLSGGYEIIGFSMLEIPESNLTSGLELVNETVGADVVLSYERVAVGYGTMNVSGMDDFDYSMMGFSDRMISEARYSLMRRAPQYETDEEAWNAIIADHSLIIMDGSVVPSQFGMTTFSPISLDIGDVIRVTSPLGAQTNVTIVGIMDQYFNTGMYCSSEFLHEFNPLVKDSMLYFETSPTSGIPDAEVSMRMEQVFVEYGLTTIVVRDVVETAMTMVASVMQLMEIFLGMGLIVGIAGLGIITIRNVAERRQEIGVMRAIGYQRDMILKAFLLETSFMSLLGIAIGTLMGLGISYTIFVWGGFSKMSVFVIPWGEIFLVLVIAFSITLAATLPPSRRAARLAPAEALRRID